MSWKASRDDNFFLSENSDRARLRDAEKARKNRVEIVKALSQGKISRRELVRMGLFTAAGVIAPIGGLSPFVRPANAQTTSGSRCFGFDVPTGMSPSPTFGVAAFSKQMPRQS
jgi:hypothetical protein